MLIASKIHRPLAPIVLGNGEGKPKTAYYFKPVDPNNPLSEHVAEVTNRVHIQKLLQIAEGYHIAETEPADASAVSKPVPVAPAPAAQPAAPPAVAKTEGQVIEGTEPIPGHDDSAPDVTGSDPTALLALPLKEFKAAIKGGDKGLLQAALATEQAKSDTDQRPTVIRALAQELKVK